MKSSIIYMKYFILIFSIVLSLQSLGQKLVIENGDTLNRYDAQGKKNGIWVEHYGAPRITGNYSHGSKEGIWLAYFESGRLNSAIEYHKGMQTGCAAKDI